MTEQTDRVPTEALDTTEALAARVAELEAVIEELKAFGQERIDTALKKLATDANEAIALAITRETSTLEARQVAEFQDLAARIEGNSRMITDLDDKFTQALAE
ncbi:hypothetical protein [Erythrobacter colymbi]|uniref:hypothetical protein n=1 Tax=Erythrobacter colymbi TaxID=1161202 RepID=UPI000A3B91C9|nr:hypothetical protein [Erythrobacter colymbi]